MLNQPLSPTLRRVRGLVPDVATVELIENLREEVRTAPPTRPRINPFANTRATNGATTTAALVCPNCQEPGSLQIYERVYRPSVISPYMRRDTQGNENRHFDWEESLDSYDEGDFSHVYCSECDWESSDGDWINELDIEP